MTLKLPGNVLGTVIRTYTCLRGKTDNVSCTSEACLALLLFLVHDVFPRLQLPRVHMQHYWKEPCNLATNNSFDKSDEVE